MRPGSRFSGRTRLIIGLVVAGLIVWLGYFLTTRFVLFNVVDSPKNVSSSTLDYVFKFNRQLKPDQDLSQVVAFSQDIQNIKKIDGDTLKIYLSDTPELNQAFEVSFFDIESKDGSKFSKTFSYYIEYRPASELTEEEIQTSIERSDSFEGDFPIMKSLPIIAKNYQIDFEFPSSEENKMPITIACLTENPTPTTINGDPLTESDSSSQMKEYLLEIKNCREQALTKLKAIGYDQSKYKLLCTENFLIKQTGCEYLALSSESDSVH